MFLTKIDKPKSYVSNLVSAHHQGMGYTVSDEISLDLNNQYIFIALELCEDSPGTARTTFIASAQLLMNKIDDKLIDEHQIYALYWNCDSSDQWTISRVRSIKRNKDKSCSRLPIIEYEFILDDERRITTK